MTIRIAFVTHNITEDNEAGRATGWLGGTLSVKGRENAAAMGQWPICQGIQAIFTSDLARAVETVDLAFPDTDLPVLKDWRLRECDYGLLNGGARDEVLADRSAHLDRQYPRGESWRQAVARVGRFLDDLPSRWDGQRLLVVGHVATRLGLEHFTMGRSLSDLLQEDFLWQEGWEYELD